MTDHDSSEALSEFNARSIGTLVASVITLLLSSGTLTTTATLFFLPLTREFGWSQTQYTTLFAICTYACAITGFFLGRATDRWGARRVVLPTAVYTGCALMGLRLLNGSFAQALVLYALAGAGAASAVCYFRLVAVWFRRHLGLALSISTVAAGLLSYTVDPILVQRVYEHWGWRESFIIWGIVYLIVALPLQLLFAHDPDGAVGSRKPAARSFEEIGVPLREALFTRALWFIFWIDLFGFSVSTALRLHAVPLLAQYGLAQRAAANILALSGFAAMAIRPVFGWLLDKIDSAKIVAPFGIMVPIGLAIFLPGTTAVPLLLTAMVLVTAGTTSEAAVGQYFLTRYYGRRHYGQIVSVIYVATPVGIGIGPLVLGYLHDRSHDYTQGIAILLLLSITVLAFLFLLGPYRYAATARREGERRESIPAEASPLSPATRVADPLS
jgi:nitrate/nitrite transporter NarK